MSLEAIQQKKQIIESRSRIREFVFGIQDGLISTVGLLAGSPGRDRKQRRGYRHRFHRDVFRVRFPWRRVRICHPRAQKDIFDKEMRRRRKARRTASLISLPEGLLKALGEEGLSKEQSYRMVKVLLPGAQRFHAHISGKSLRAGQRGNQSAVPGGVGDGAFFHRRRIVPIVPYHCFGRRDGALSVGLLERH